MWKHTEELISTYRWPEIDRDAVMDEVNEMWTDRLLTSSIKREGSTASTQWRKTLSEGQDSEWNLNFKG